MQTIGGGSPFYLVMGVAYAPLTTVTGIRMLRCGIDATTDGALVVRHLWRDHHIGPGALVDVRLRSREFRHDREIVLVTRTGEIRTGVIEGGDAALVRETAAGLRMFCTPAAVR